MRARPLLAQLKHLVGPGVIGFMPGREAGEVWHYVQTLIEWALQSSQQLHGVVSDVRKAFESIPRTPLFAVMSFLGFPAPLLSAWSRFWMTRTSVSVERPNWRHDFQAIGDFQKAVVCPYLQDCH